MARTLKVAAVAGDLDWSYRKTCSDTTYDEEIAHRYVSEYTQRNIERVRGAAREGAQIIVGQEYFRGSELFITERAHKKALVEAPDGETSSSLREISAEYDASVCCSYECDLGSHTHQTAVLTANDGTLRGVHVKHPRTVPAPANWPFNTGVRIYDIAVAKAGITVCSDLTYDPRLPLRMAAAGMEILLLPGCGFMNALWKHFLVVRAIDTATPIVYADDRRAAIVDAEGRFVETCEGAGEVIVGEISIG